MIKLLNRFLLQRPQLTLLLITGAFSLHAQTANKSSKPQEPLFEKAILPKGADQQTLFRCCMKDTRGNLWFGTTGAGIYKYDGKSFIHLDEKNGIENPIIYSITEDKDGLIWVGTQDGIFRGKENTFERFKLEGFSHNSTSNMMLSATNSSDKPKKIETVFSIVQDKRGNMWFGTEFDGLYCYNGKSTRNFRFLEDGWYDIVRQEIPNVPVHPNQMVPFIFESKDGSIWFSSVGNESTGAFQLNNGIFTKYTDDQVFKMIEDSAGTIWMGTRDNGVYLFEKNSDAFTQEADFCERRANELIQDKNGIVWIASEGNPDSDRGCVATFKGRTISSFPTEAMENDHICSMLEDNKGVIWFGTQDFGLYCYDPMTAKFTKLSQKDAIR